MEYCDPLLNFFCVNCEIEYSFAMTTRAKKKFVLQVYLFGSATGWERFRPLIFGEMPKNLLKNESLYAEYHQTAGGLLDIEIFRNYVESLFEDIDSNRASTYNTPTFTLHIQELINTELCKHRFTYTDTNIYYAKSQTSDEKILSGITDSFRSFFNQKFELTGPLKLNFINAVKAIAYCWKNQTSPLFVHNKFRTFYFNRFEDWKIIKIASKKTEERRFNRIMGTEHENNLVPVRPSGAEELKRVVQETEQSSNVVQQDSKNFSEIITLSDNDNFDIKIVTDKAETIIIEDDEDYILNQINNIYRIVNKINLNPSFIAKLRHHLHILLTTLDTKYSKKIVEIDLS